MQFLMVPKSSDEEYSSIQFNSICRLLIICWLLRLLWWFLLVMLRILLFVLRHSR